MSRFWLTYRRRKHNLPKTIPIKPRLWWWRKHLAEIPQNARVLFNRFRSRPQVARVLAGSITLLKMLADAIEPILGKVEVRRGVSFGLGSFLILGVLILLLSQPTISPAQIIVASVLMLVSVVAMFVMDLFD